MNIKYKNLRLTRIKFGEKLCFILRDITTSLVSEGVGFKSNHG